MDHLGCVCVLMSEWSMLRMITGYNSHTDMIRKQIKKQCPNSIEHFCTECLVDIVIPSVLQNRYNNHFVSRNIDI